jgi:hypothetical protein
VTRSFEHYMQHARDIRKRLDPAAATIYLATDSDTMLAASRDPKWTAEGWKFVYNPQALKSTGTDFMWFKQSRGKQAVNVMADLEGLRRADFLVGSFQSNVYRLAAELNNAFHGGRTYSPHTQRIFAVESIEWYTDP